MINFFRRIRQQLFTENKFRKYLLYAIGEIVLVVVGILIALQVDNWNEVRKSRNFEINILSEIEKSLKGDLSFLQQGIKPRVDLKREALQQLLEMRQSTKSFQDSVILAAYNQANMGLLLTYNKGPYETIKSVGLDKIGNDSLRTLLARVYEIDLPRVLDIVKVIDGDQAMAIEKIRLHNSIWKRKQIQLPDKSWKIVSTPIEEGILLTSELLDRIKIEQDNANIYSFWINNLEIMLKETIGAIETELSDIKS